jgi:type IV pilus assembly protein PilA
MVVVAIIGLLSAVAIPNFRKYQAKTKTSEAKLQLSAIYTAMQSWYSDYDNYANCLNLMGYDPAVEFLSRYYAVGFPVGANPAGNAQSVNNGAPVACNLGSVGKDDAVTVLSTTNTSAWGAGKRMANNAPFTSADVNTPNIANIAQPTSAGGGAVPTFRAGAIGKIDASKVLVSNADAWTIDQDKRIVNERTGY